MTRKFGAYEILHELKSGGMGAVLLARRRGPGGFEQLVAIKTIRPEYASAEAVRAMFLDEARILAQVRHPGVASVHDFGEDGGTLYMVMEYVAGIPFRDLVDKRLPPTIVARAIAEACRGLHAAHELHDLHGNVLGLVHRDVSPDNLLLGFDGHVKVIDFGIALVKKNRQAPVTEFGTVKGKPPYMSPEQVKNDPMDRRSDVFSLGVVMWEMLTGEALFDGDSMYAIAFAVDSKEIVPPSQIGGALPMGLDAVVMNALDRKLDSRTGTAAQLAEQLEAVVAATGEETLASWAARELAGQRDEHRVWLAGIATGEQPLPKAIGRPSGSVTQLAASPGQPQPLALAATPVDAAKPEIATHLPPEVIDTIPPPRRRVGLAVAAALLLLAVVGVVLLAVRPRGDAVVAPVDARGVDAAKVPAPDAPVVPPPPVIVDAATIDDAPVHATVRPDARVAPPRHDAAIAVAAQPDAAVAVAPSGTGHLNIYASPFAHIVIDGKPVGNTPQFKREIAAGTHVVELLDAVDDHSRVKRTLVVHDGDVIDVHP